MSDGAVADDESIFERDDSRVVVDAISMDFVRGSTVDFTEELIRRSFVVMNNPNTESGCGCGTSFAVKEPEDDVDDVDDDDDDDDDDEDDVRR